MVLRPGSRNWRTHLLPDAAERIEVDLADRTGVDAAVAQSKPDWVFHLAAHGAYSYQKDLSRILSVNVTGTVNLVQACLDGGVQTLVNAGSSSEYGYKDHPASETEMVEPNSHYAWAKASATQFCRYSAQAHGVSMPTLRLYSVYGPYEEPGRLVPALVAHGRSGRFPPLTNPSTARDFVYVDDVVDAFLLAASSDLGGDLGAVYNLGTGVQTSLGEAAGVVAGYYGLSRQPRWGTMASRDWDTDVWVADPRKITQDLGWKSQHTFAQGLAEFDRWFDDHPQLRARYNPG